VLLQLGTSNIRQVVIARHDDHPQRLGDLLVAEAAHAVSRQLIEAIGDLLSGFPGDLRWAIETGVREPAAMQSVKALADRAKMDRRTCLRWFAKAQLPPPSVTLTALRVVYAHRLLQDPGYTIEDVATKLGYAQTRSFAQNVREVLGRTPGEIRLSLSPEEALAIVRERYFSQRRLRLIKAS
jgi:transcriptional regulator GlxA family with amidase domain